MISDMSKNSLVAFNYLKFSFVFVRFDIKRTAFREVQIVRGWQICELKD